MSLEQQCNKIQCPITGHDKKPIILICFNKACQEQCLLCVKCKPTHESHEQYILKVTEVESFITGNQQPNQMGIELIKQFTKCKQLVIDKLDMMQLSLQSSLDRIYNNTDIKDVLKVKGQLKYTDIKEMMDRINQLCQFNVTNRQIEIISKIQQQQQLNTNIATVILQLQSVSRALTDQQMGQSKNSSKISLIKQPTTIKLLDKLALDPDGTPTLTRIKNTKQFIISFRVDKSFELSSVFQPMLHKGIAGDYQSSPIIFIYRIHHGLDLTQHIYEHQCQILHNEQEKQSNCYVIRFPEPVRLIQLQQYTLSITISIHMAYTQLYEKQSASNPYLTVQYRKSQEYKRSKQIQELQDYGYCPQIIIQ